HPLATLESVGAFAIVANAGDLDHDGVPEYTLLSGDANDLWLTLYEGKTGAAIWSHRALELPLSSYTSAIPRIRAFGLPDGNITSGLGRGVFAIDMHLDITARSFFSGVCIGCNGGDIDVGESS